MKLLLLVTLLRAGATASRISPQAGWRFGNLFRCTIPLLFPSPDPISYGCYCGFFMWRQWEKDLDRCCQACDNCYAQVKNLESCKFITGIPYGSSYLYSCSGNEITCSDKNNPCDAFICNCDRQAAICFSKQNKGDRC